MFLNAPLFSTMWIREFSRMHAPISVGFVETLQSTTQVVLIGYLVLYSFHLWKTASSGARINPIKYAFIAASYFLWYFVAWNTNSILLYAVAHRLMHGVQYIVMVYSYMQRTAAKGPVREGFWTRVVGPGRLRWFLVGGVAYALVFQLMINQPLDQFGFGVVNFAPYPAIAAFNLPALDYQAGYAMFSQVLVNTYGLMHYYLDSFIWKVQDKQTQRGL